MGTCIEIIKTQFGQKLSVGAERSREFENDRVPDAGNISTGVALTHYYKRWCVECIRNNE